VRLRSWRLSAWLSAIVLIWITGVAAVQSRDKPAIEPSQYGYLRGIFFSNAKMGWAVGEAGNIVASVDGGQTWRPQSAPTNENLSRVQFVGSNGWVVGDNGVILATRDEGKTWDHQKSETTAELHDVFADKTGVVWAVGELGTILKTLNRGENWFRRRVEPYKHLWGLDFVDRSNGWAVGDDGVILTTHNGGENWIKQDSGTTARLFSVNFVDELTGWAVGAGGTIVATVDGGRTWTQQKSPFGGPLRSVSFANVHSGWVVGDIGTIITTDDGGQTWRSQRSATESDLLGVYFRDDRTGWAVGKSNTILSTRDGGDNWLAVRDLAEQASPGQAEPQAPATSDKRTLFGIEIKGTAVEWGLAATVVLALLSLGLAFLQYRQQKQAALEQQLELEELRFRFERMRAGDIDTSSAPDDAISTSSSVVVPEIPTGLLNAVNRGECTLFWGGGLSAQAGYPTWREALAGMIEDAEADEPFKAGLRALLSAGRFSLVVDSLATRLSRAQIIGQLSKRWGAPRPITPTINAISRLPFTNAVTSVWDPLIEQAFARRDPVVVMGVSSESLERLLTREAFCIVRLWGALSRPDSVLFTNNEYRTAVAGNQTFAKYLASLTLSQSHLFVGASLETIEEYLSSTPRDTSTHKHYALVPESEGIELAREVFRERGVELLVFRPTPGWPELPAFLTKLEQAIRASAPAPASDIETILLKRIELQNIGPFKSVSLDFDPNWNVLLGNNGVGKSTILRSIALVVCGDDSRAMAEGARLLRTDAASGFVQLTVGSNIYRTELVRDSGGTVHVNVGTRVAPLKAGRWVILAFPPLRGVSGENPKGPTTEGSSLPVVQDVLPILVGQIDSRLSSLKQWLVNLDVRSRAGDGVTATDAATNQKLRDHFFKVFNAFVPGTDVQFSGVDRNTWQVYVTSHGAKIGIEQLSQGTNSILGWVGAMLQRIYEIHGYSDSEPGLQRSAVVLIDEIDAHLHPDWQQRIVGALAEQFPVVQFVATAHSPLIVGELEQHQVFRMERQADGEVIVFHPKQPLKGLGVAGLLTSDMFGLTRVVDKDTQALLEEQRILSVKESLTAEDRIRLDDLNRQLDELGFGYQMRDREYTRYLQERARLVRERAGPQPVIDQTPREPPERVKELIRAAIARATKDSV
jgi:photosystem II stability/assembly factor-like uncharacterized protein/energy-coupling factor transporter ATP-binding protein EcfA2